MNKYYVYILQLSEGSYYIGATENLKKRLEKHQRGYVRSTKYRLPFILRHMETFATLSEARKREEQVKSWKSRKSIEKLFNTVPSSSG